MNINGDIIIIEDDADDRDILMHIFQDLDEEYNYENRLVFIEDPTDVIDFLKSDECDPFLIISDINMPVINGFDLRNLIFSDAKLRECAIPFIFLTTSDNSEENMRKAFQLSIQGYFTKPISYPKFKKVINDIISYWKNAKMN